MEFFTVTIGKGRKQIPLPGTMGTPDFGGVEFSKFIVANECLTPHTGTDLAAEDVIRSIPYYCSETIKETIKMMSGSVTKDWKQLHGELNDAYCQADSCINIYTRSYLEQLSKYQLEYEKISLKAIIITYDNISHIMINMEAFTEYTQLEILRRALGRDFRSKVVLKHEYYPRDHTMLEYDQLLKHVLDNCATNIPLAHLDSERAQTSPGVSPYSIPAPVPLLQMPVVVNHATIPSEETPAPVQATDEIPIAITENSIDTKMDNMVNASDTWTFQLGEANDPSYGSDQTASAYVIQADHPPPHTPMNFPPLNAPTEPTYFRLGPEYQQYP